VVILPQVKARDAAGKAAGVSGTYVDKASDSLVRQCPTPDALASLARVLLACFFFVSRVSLEGEGGFAFTFLVC